jgi:acetyl-CoA C-acetyltransferase
VLRPAADIVTRAEIQAGLAMPVTQYSIVENALRAADGETVASHRRRVAELWEGFSRVAAANPDAWSREALDAEEIGEPGPGNRMLAFPYTKRLVSQWNVDQAAGLVICSLETARAMALPEDRRVFPLAVVDSEHMLPLTLRRELHRSPGFALAGERALAHAQREISEVAHLELYSCFPSAVRVQQRELGIPPDRPVTVTGGMTFAGGPLNNFVLQCWVRMARVLRDDPGSAGMVNAISGIITKQGVTLFSTEPNAGFAFDDVTREAAARSQQVEVVETAEGPATVASYTVLYEGEKPARAVLVCDLASGRRAIAVAEDADLAAEGTREELCGRALELRAGGVRWS